MAQEAEVNQEPIEPPCVLLAGGELVVAVGDETGLGGRNEEFTLAAAPRTAGSENIPWKPSPVRANASGNSLTAFASSRKWE